MSYRKREYMRQLTVSQKKIIDLAMATQKIDSADDLMNDTWLQLERINDTEILYQEVNRYIEDKRV